jgi:hypothetical protein
VAEISDVALLNRLRNASDWLGLLLGLKLAERAPPPDIGATDNRRLRLVDATTISKPGSKGTDWRVHLGFDLGRLAIDHVELTDSSGGETLARFCFSPGEVVIGDRGYAHRRGLYSADKSGARTVVRLNWQNLPLQTPDGAPFDLLDALRRLPEAVAGEHAVRVAPSKRDRIPAVPGRLVAVRKTAAAAEAARAKVLKERAKKGRKVDPRTLEAAGYIFLFTTLSSSALAAAQVLELYRFRWQVELAFKRLKSLLRLGELPTRDPPLARSFIFAKLLTALLLEDFTEEFLAFSPWGHRLARKASFAVANPSSTS